MDSKQLDKKNKSNLIKEIRRAKGYITEKDPELIKKANKDIDFIADELSKDNPNKAEIESRMDELKNVSTVAHITDLKIFIDELYK